MSLSRRDIAFLQGDTAREALSKYAERDLSPRNSLSLLSEMRRSLDMREAAAILTTLRLRQRAEAKFPSRAHKLLFTDGALQQASHPLVREYRAREAQGRSVLDVCCGIGADTVAFAQSGREALGLDIDPARIDIARHNAEVLGSYARFALGDARAELPAGAHDCIFFDPSRRDGRGRRIHDVERYQPPLSTMRKWRARELLVKLSPGVDTRQLAGYGGRLEFISVAGALTEALLWLNRETAPPSALLLTAQRTYRFSRRPGAHAETSPPRAWLLEPDPAILRAGLVGDLAVELGAFQLDETIAYLTLDEGPETPWGRCWRVLDWMPFQLKRLRRYLLERDVGAVTVKKRGFALSPDELIARLRLKGGRETRMLVATRCRGRPVVIICEERVFG